MENMKIPEIHYFGAIMAPELAEMHSEPMPEALGPKDILVKMLICNICTNDYQTWQAKRTSKNRFPMASGHEWVGDVVAIGEDVKLFQIGTAWASAPQAAASVSCAAWVIPSSA